VGLEIERKYLVDKEKWSIIPKENGHYISQGYMLNDHEKSIRIRLIDNQGFLNIKGAVVGASRPEYEYEIPKEEAIELLEKFCAATISKIRYCIHYKGKLWEVDEFLGENEGLIVAEIELESENETFELPEWAGKEVTSETKYYNPNLSVKPYKKWKAG
jgi:CYTH domain-containing protein